LPFCTCRASLAIDVYQYGPQFRVRQGFNPSKLSREPNDIRSKLGPLSIVSNQTNVIYRAVDTMKVPQTRSLTNLRHFPDRIGIGNIALSPHEKESRFRNLGNFYLFYLKILIMESRIQLKESRIPLTTIGIQNPSSTDKYWNPVQSRSTWNPEYTAWNPILS